MPANTSLSLYYYPFWSCSIVGSCIYETEAADRIRDGFSVFSWVDGFCLGIKERLLVYLLL